MYSLYNPFLTSPSEEETMEVTLGYEAEKGDRLLGLHIRKKIVKMGY